jgi:hypothetical protein
MTQSVYYIQPKTFDFLLAVDGVSRNMVLSKRIHAYEVGVHSRLLQPINKSKEFSSTLRRVIYTKPSSRGRAFKLFYGTFENITFNLGYEGEEGKMRY